MDKEKIVECISSGKTALGIELGSTRIKAVLIDESNEPVASGSYDWSNHLVDHIWTYDLSSVWLGIAASYKELKKEVKRRYDIELRTVGVIGISAMMHGYLSFDSHDDLLVPFRTWRNNITSEASTKLTKVFNYPIPQRWSISHLYQAMINEETHVKDINYLTTLAGYVHWQLTGEKVIGVGDGSGMFPIDLKTKSFNENMMVDFEKLELKKQYNWKLHEVVPKVLVAGELGGRLTESGAKRLDPLGNLKSGIPFCPPEGDAGTGMVATNSVGQRTCNVSAGTSVFAMLVLEDELSRVYDEIDQVTTPSGSLVAMAHGNNCTTELNAWVRIFGETLSTFGLNVEDDELYGTLYNKALEGDPDCGGLLSYGYHSGEHMTHFEEGRPLFVRKADSKFNLANFIKVNLYTALGALKIGMDILIKEEGVKLDLMFGHGGLFKTEGVGQQEMANAIGVPVSVMKTAGEGGAWGIALLASYLLNKKEENLEEYLSQSVFNKMDCKTIKPDLEGVDGFEMFMERYRHGLSIEKAAIEYLK